MSWGFVALWVLLGFVAAMLDYGRERYRWGHLETKASQARRALVFVPFGISSLIGIVLFLSIDGRMRDALRYWRNGRTTRAEERAQTFTHTLGSPQNPVQTWFGVPVVTTTASTNPTFGAPAFTFTQMPTPPTAEPVPTEHTPEPVYAWRWWGLDAVSLLLEGATNYRWNSGTQTAEHRGRMRHFGWDGHTTAPHPGCLCGINAVKPDYVAELTSYSGKGPDVFGRLALTGTIDEYEKGYRAEKAEIVELVILSDAPLFTIPAVLDRLEERYGVRPTVQSRKSWLAEMEVIHGLGKEDQADRFGAGQGTSPGAGQGTSQDWVNGTCGLPGCVLCSQWRRK